MTKLRPTVPLLALAGALGLVALLGWIVARGSDGPAGPESLIWIFALMLMLELPAFWWRGRGGSGPETLLAAVAGPLLVFEGLLALSAWQYRNSGGDLHGVEQILMVVVLVPILLSGAVTAFLAVLLVERDDPDG
jgi:hypothetical protein